MALTIENKEQYRKQQNLVSTQVDYKLYNMNRLYHLDDYFVI